MNNLEYQNKLKKLDIIPLEDYINNRTKIKHKCLKCNNEFINSPYNIIINNNGCLICNKNNKFKEKIKDFNLTILDNYKNNTTPLTFKCLLCGNIFVKTPSYILKNKYKCKCSLNNKKSSIDFKEILNKLDSNYILLSNFKNTKTKVKLKHCICGLEYEVTPANFIYRNRRCPKCSKRLRKNTDIIKKEIYDLYKDEYQLKSEYINDKTKISLLHKICNREFKVTASIFLNKHTKCPYCFGSYKKSNNEFKKQIYSKII